MTKITTIADRDHFLRDRVKIIGAALLCIAFSSSALTLGRVRGAVLVGQPLNVVVPVQIEASEDVASLCFEADVFHADTRQDASHIHVRIEPTAQPTTASVRVISSAIIDEPVVTVYLRTGCGQKTTRRYVLLADLASEVAAPPVARVTPVLAPPLATPDSAAAAPTSAVKTKTGSRSKTPTQLDAGRPQPSAKGSEAAPSPAPTRTRSQAAEKNKSEKSTGQSRLKLDPLELLSDRVANLDSFMTFEPPEDAVRSLQRIQTLEGAVKAGQALAAKNEASLADLKHRLQKAESERYPAGVLYGLIALVLACLAAVAFLWYRQRSVPLGGDWWSASSDATESLMADPDPVPSTKFAQAAKGPDTVRAPEQPVMSADSVLSILPGASAHMDIKLTEMSESTFGDFMLTDTARGNGQQALPPSAAQADMLQKPATNFNTDSMLDIRQQADFFVSLGQTDRAVRILKKKIEESQEPNPFFYLDLLDIFHSLGLKVDFQQIREEFNRLFTGKVPEFSFYKNEGKSLESHADVLSRISALWPTPAVLAEIESSIFRATQAGKSKAFELAAFRELLLLHSVARSVALDPGSDGNVARIDALPGAQAPQSGLMDLDLNLDLHFSEVPTQEAASGSDAPLDSKNQFDSGNLIDFNLPAAPHNDKF